MKNDAKISLAWRHPKKNRIILLLLSLSVMTFIVGITAPMLTFNKFFIFSNEVSLLSGLWELLMEGYVLLFIIIFVFSIAFPILKIVLLSIFWLGRLEANTFKERILKWLVTLGKWSMLDVFVAALLIVTIRLGAVANVEAHYGLYTFALSVILTMIASAAVHRTYLETIRGKAVFSEKRE